jgi:hypothetical protein
MHQSQRNDLSVTPASAPSASLLLSASVESGLPDRLGSSVVTQDVILVHPLAFVAPPSHGTIPRLVSGLLADAAIELNFRASFVGFAIFVVCFMGSGLTTLLSIRLSA